MKLIYVNGCKGIIYNSRILKDTLFTDDCLVILISWRNMIRVDLNDQMNYIYVLLELHQVPQLTLPSPPHVNSYSPRLTPSMPSTPFASSATTLTSSSDKSKRKS